MYVWIQGDQKDVIHFLKIVLTRRTAGERPFSRSKSSEIRFYLVCLIHLWPPCRKSLLLRQIVCMER